MTALDLLELPGPARFIDRVCVDVAAGRSVVVVFPQAAVASGLADRVVDSVGSQAGAGLVDSDGTHLPTQVAETLGFLEDWRPGADPWWDLAHWRALGGRAVAIRSWEHRVSTVLERWEALTHEASRAPAERLRLVVGVGLEDVLRAGLERTPPLHLAVHWWWGVIDRIDTELDLRRREPPQDRLQHAEQVERIAWDLGSQRANEPGDEDHETHGRSPDRECQRATGPLPRMALDHERAPRIHREVPPVSLREAWDLGMVELWDGRFRPRVGDHTGAIELGVLRWRAQVQILFPYLEEHRLKLQHAFVPKAKEAGLSADASDTWEIGEMYAAVNNCGVRLSLNTYEHLRAAREVRNALAHGRPADEKYLGQLLRVIPL